MVATAVFMLSVTGILIASVTHFWILARLHGTGLSTRYFSYFGDNIRAYKNYAMLARQKGWPIWPVYIVVGAGIGGLVGGFLSVLFSPTASHWLGKP